MVPLRAIMILGGIAALASLGASTFPAACTPGTPATDGPGKGAFATGAYPNLFMEVLGLPEAAVRTRVDSVFHQLFYGNDSTERLYYPVGDDRAYILDIGNNDVRTEGMSYGMMIAVQLNKRAEFDRLWKWVKDHMENREGPHRGYFAWHCRADGTVLSPGAASDGEEWFVTSLLFASARWGDGKGIANYRAEAGKILSTMLHKEEESGRGNVTNMFDSMHHLVTFVPSTPGNSITDPSYQVPHFYELWARWAGRDSAFWVRAAESSRRLLRKAAHPATGLSPDYSTFDGQPVDGWGGGHRDFRFDAWRVAMNTAVDWLWFRKDPWQVEYANRLLEFFHTQGVRTYGNQFTLDGKQLDTPHSAGLVAMNAVAALASTSACRREFVSEFWSTRIPTGHYRYYDGILYMLGMLQLSGQFRIYDPAGCAATQHPQEGTRGHH